MKPLKIAFLHMVFTFFYLTMCAQVNTDLPNPVANLQPLPAGSLIIAMDNTNQAAPGYFNLRTYGLVTTLMWADKRLRWVIKAGKAKDGVDIIVMAERLYPIQAAAISRNFKAGPFVIFPQDTAGVAAIISTFNSSLNTNQKVQVYRTTAAVQADIRYNLTGLKPKAAIMNLGGKANIHTGYMAAALIPMYAYSVKTTPSAFAGECITFISEPHNSNNNTVLLTRMIDSLKLFLERDGGNFLAECAAVRTYENHANGRFHFSNGISDVNRNVVPSNNIFPHPDLSNSQFEGAYDMNDGGNLRNWSCAAGGVNKNNVYAGVKDNHANRDTIGFSTSKMDATKKGGLVTYLGNHRFGTNNQMDINGIRIYMNAFLTPSRNTMCFNGGPLAVKFIDFEARYRNNSQVTLTWSTSSEYNSKEFIIERSPDSEHFYAIGTLAATGNSSTIKSYNFNDLNPVTGKNFYRITEVDVNGNMNFSVTRYVKINTSGTMDVEIYPNPANHFITINTGNTTSLTYTVLLYDMTGRLMSSHRFTGTTTQLDLRAMQPGNYIISLASSNGDIMQHKIVVYHNK